MALPLKDAFTARAIGTAWDGYKASQALPPYLGRSFFGTQKKTGLDLKFILGEDAVPRELKGSNFDAQAPLREGIGFKTIEQNMPFFRESYMVTEKEEQDYMTFMNSLDPSAANDVLTRIMKNPMNLISAANIVPERMIWQLLAPTDGVPKITIAIDGDYSGKAYVIDYTSDSGSAYKATNFIDVTATSGSSASTTKWSASATATPIADLVAAQEQQIANHGQSLSTFAMNLKTWKQLVNAEDTKKQVLGAIAYNAGIAIKDADVKSFLLANYGITVLVYNKIYASGTSTSTFIPDGIVSGIAQGVNRLGDVFYGTTPEERSGDLASGNLSIVETGVAVYTYTTNHPVNTHCVVSEIVLPSYENMNSVVVMKVDA